MAEAAPRKSTRRRAPKPPPSPTRRRRSGSGFGYWLDGVKVPGPTTIISDGLPKKLEDWVARTTAGYAVDNWQELSEVKPSERLDRLTRARWDVTNKAAVKGTKVHDLAHRLGAGFEVEVPEELEGYVESYLRFVEAFHVEEILAEFAVFKRLPWGGYGGSPDLLAHLVTPLDPDPTRWLLDFKTGKGVYDDAALQLAAYNEADVYLDDDGNEVEWEPAERLGVVHLRADGFDLREINQDPEGELAPFDVFMYAMQTARFKNAPRGTYLGDAIAPAREDSE